MKQEKVKFQKFGNFLVRTANDLVWQFKFHFRFIFTQWRDSDNIEVYKALTKILHIGKEFFHFILFAAIENLYSSFGDK